MLKNGFYKLANRFHANLDTNASNISGNLSCAVFISMKDFCLSIIVYSQSNLKRLLKANAQCFHTDSDYLLIGIVVIINYGYLEYLIRLFLFLAFNSESGVFPGQGSGICRHCWNLHLQ